MKLVVIYGPPAVGKLTVTRELAKITRFKIFHNHFTWDIAEIIYGPDDPEILGYLNKLRWEFFEEAAKKDMNIIFTVCYTKDLEKFGKFLEKTIKIVRKNKGKICLVQLITTKEILRKRVREKSRKKTGKLKTMKGLDKALKKYDFFSPFNKKHLVIDNTKLSAKQAALKIKKHYELK